MAYDESGYTGGIGYTGPGIPDVTRKSNPRQPDTNNHLLSNYFKLEITRLPLVTYFCQSVNLPSVNLSPMEQGSRMGTPIKWVGGRYDFDSLTVNFIIDEDMKNWIEVFEWMESIGAMADGAKTLNSKVFASPPEQFSDYFSDATLVITNSSYKPKIKVTLKDIFPISLSGIEFNSTLLDTQPVVATAVFTYTYYSINTLSSV
jgi:hypothetical protein